MDMKISRISTIVAVFVLTGSIYRNTTMAKVAHNTSDNKFVKCCENDFVASEDLKGCVSKGFEQIDYRQILEVFGQSLDPNFSGYSTCFQDMNSTTLTGNSTSGTFTSNVDCIDSLKNGSLVHLNCETIIKNITSDRCDSIFNLVYIYGAPMMICANIVYIVLYFAVCVVYALNPKICRRAYDKVVLTFTMSQIILSIIIIIIGSYFLCHKTPSKATLTIFGIIIMILVISSCLWLLIISLDVALTITKIRWAPSSGTRNRDENHKFRVYLLWVIIVTMIPTAISTIFEFSPLSEDHILKPQFYKMTTVNFKVIIQVSIMPVLIGMASNILFIYTTAKMISIQRSANFAHENRKNNIWKKYILYLKLYLFMDAPYVTAALGSIYPNLWILKFSRLAQPILMLYAVLPREVIAKVIPYKKKQAVEKDQSDQKFKNIEEHC